MFSTVYNVRAHRHACTRAYIHTHIPLCIFCTACIVLYTAGGSSSSSSEGGGGGRRAGQGSHAIPSHIRLGRMIRELGSVWLLPAHAAALAATQGLGHRCAMLPPSNGPPSTELRSQSSKLLHIGCRQVTVCNTPVRTDSKHSLPAKPERDDVCLSFYPAASPFGHPFPPTKEHTARPSPQQARLWTDTEQDRERSIESESVYESCSNPSLLTSLL